MSNHKIQNVHFGEDGSLKFIEKFVASGEQGAYVFIVAGKKSYSVSGAEKFFENTFSDIPTTFFHDFTSNPKIDDVQNGIQLFNSRPHNLIITVGGGSAIDIGKSINFFVSNNINPNEYLRHKKTYTNPCFSMMAVPTTAGTGSESTQFAVMYDGMVKHSIDQYSILPSHVLLIPKFIESQSKYLSACSGMDTLAHGIESYWAVGATNESLEYSEKSIKLCMQHLEKSINESNMGHKEGMVKAACFAGKAINITRTTASHALSYSMTAHYGLSHGHAVALTLPTILRMNAEIVSYNVNSNLDLNTIQQRMQNLYSFFGNNCSAEDVAKLLEELADRIGLSRRWFTEMKYDIIKVRHIILKEINEDRLKNNPRKFDDFQLTEIVSKIR